MSSIFSDRITDVPKSFIREILKVTGEKNVISLAGGLPNRNLFPIEPIKKALNQVMENDAADALQYSTTEGYEPLRTWIADRYLEKQGIVVSPEHILITNGSQQALDLIGKVLINENDRVILEEPGYIGAIQAFSMYRPHYAPVELLFDGPNTQLLKKVLEDGPVKLMYGVPNFQNPSGISYSEEKRKEIAQLLLEKNVIFVEDDPYGELRFAGTKKSSLYQFMGTSCILLGSFSKVFVPSMRLGWIVCPPHLYDKFVIAKQAADLHTNYFGQRVVHSYLLNNSLDKHIETIAKVYGNQCGAMVNAIHEFFPKEVIISNPQGGMFLWAVLPKGICAMEVFEKALAAGVAFVPGDPFYVNKKNVSTMRLNFSCVEVASIELGIRILGTIIHSFTKG